MRAYFVSDTHNQRYFATMKEAHEAAKQMSRFNVTIELVEVPLDQANVLRLLNADGGTQQSLRYWELSVRGGLKEIPSLYDQYDKVA